jgi:NADPH:quinone reductase-like Zn-dependent oxidoreductase
MRAVVITKHGGPNVLEVQERPDPPLGAGQVRIDVAASGINFADVMARMGLYPDAPKTPCVVGYEVAGTILELGEGVHGLTPGQRVLAGTEFNGYASQVVVRAEDVVPLPDRLSFQQGAAIPVNYGTAWAGLIGYGNLQPGERVLIHSAGGGVGIAATQIARNVGAAQIVGTASPAKHDAIRAQGVTHPIDYRNDDFEKETMRLTDGEGVDLIIDALGPTSFRKDYRLLRPGGRMVMYGLSEATKAGGRNVPAALKSLATMPLATIPWWKSLALMNENKGIFGLNMLKWWDREGSLDRVTEPLMADVEAGRLEPVIAEAFPFERAGDAHKFLAERRNVGKVVLFPT